MRTYKCAYLFQMYFCGAFCEGRLAFFIRYEYVVSVELKKQKMAIFVCVQLCQPSLMSKSKGWGMRCSMFRLQ